MYYTIYTLCTSLCTEIEHGQELHSWHRKKYICQIIGSLEKDMGQTEEQFFSFLLIFVNFWAKVLLTIKTWKRFGIRLNKMVLNEDGTYCIGIDYYKYILLHVYYK